MLRKVSISMLGYAKSLRRRSFVKNIPRKFLLKDVPYFSQWESRELNQQIVNHEIKAEDDPNWKKSGAKSKQEYADWSWSGCGMACTKMLLAHKTGKNVCLVELGKKCAEYGGYSYPLGESNGLSYAPYARFMKAEYGINALLVAPLIIEEIIAALSKGNYVIVSVSPKIRVPASHPAHKGGHLILMLGYNLDTRELIFHNPSGISKQTQEYAKVSFDDFKKFFGGRGIILEG